MSDPIKPGKRKYLTRAQVITLVIRQQMRCGCGKCGLPLEPKCVDEHVIPRESLPADRCDHIDNRALYNVPCAKLKTVGDQAIIAKGRRLRGERGSQVLRREKRGGSSIKSRSDFPTGRKLQSRSFDKRKKDAPQ